MSCLNKYLQLMQYLQPEKIVRVMKRSTRTVIIAIVNFTQTVTTTKLKVNSTPSILYVMVMVHMESKFHHSSGITIRKFLDSFFKMNYINLQNQKWVLGSLVLLKKLNNLIIYATLDKMMMIRSRDQNLALIETVGLCQDKVRPTLATFIKKEDGRLRNRNKKQ